MSITEFDRQNRRLALESARQIAEQFGHANFIMGNVGLGAFTPAGSHRGLRLYKHKYSKFEIDHAKWVIGNHGSFVVTIEIPHPNRHHHQ